MNIDEIGYPAFWKCVKDKKTKSGEKGFDTSKINRFLECPMNYIANMEFKRFRSSESTLPMDYFFKSFELDANRKTSKKVEELIEKYSLDIYNYNISMSDEDENYSDYLLLRSDFEELICDLQSTYLSGNYIGLMSWLINRAFIITSGQKRNKEIINRNTYKNKSLLLKTLYDVNPKNIIKIFSKNLDF